MMTGENSTQHVYKLPGIYTVMITVIDGAGRRTTKTAAINVTAP
jgi:PKD repeat protein